MNAAGKKRFLVAVAALSTYACGSSDIPEPQHTAHGDLPKLDYPRVATIDDSSDYVVPKRPLGVKVSRSRSAPPVGHSQQDATGNNGDLLARIAKCEGHPKYVHADHGPESTASGKYGYLDGTWNGYKGYERAMDAPEHVQDERAAADLARVGTRPWNASKGCWG